MVESKRITLLNLKQRKVDFEQQLGKQKGRIDEANHITRMQIEKE